eukprot:m.39431 g.39431  ORF g.39431 m.39431 type:complete len:340 (+) comp10308_c0_seq2:320-1339(+)
MEQPQKLAVWDAHEDQVWCVSWSRSGQLATCSADASIKLWKMRPSSDSTQATPSTAALQTELSGQHTRTVRRVSWSPTGATLASCSFDRSVCLWEVVDGEWECIATLEGHENEVKACAFSVSGTFLATCSRDKTVWIWERFEDEGEGDELDTCGMLQPHSQDVKTVRWHPTVDILATASYDDLICIIAPDASGEWDVLNKLQGHTGTVWDVDFSQTGKYLASCSADKTVRIWRNDSPEGKYFKWTCVCTLSGDHTRPIFALAWNKEEGNGMLATACGDNHVRVYREALSSTADAVSFDLVYDFEAHDQDVNGLAWNGNELATCSDNGEVAVWKLPAPAL